MGEDITKRKRTEQELKEKTALLEAILDNTPDIMGVKRPDLSVVRYNKAGYAFLDTTQEQIEGCKCYELIGRNTQCDPCATEEAIKAKQPVTLEKYVPEWDMYLNCKVNPIFSENGEIEYTIEVIRNITERKQAEEALRESEERFRLSMEATSDGLWDWNIENNLVYYSPGYVRMLGYEAHEFPEHVASWTELIHPDDKENAFQANTDCIENRVESFAVEFRMQAKGEEWKWILGRGRAVSRDSSGRATRLIGTHQDITERKHSEEKLLEYKTALEQSGEGIALASTDGHIRFVNAAWARMHGYTPDELTGRHLSVFHSEDQMKLEVAPRLERLRASGSNQGEVWHVRKDGSTFPTHMTATIVSGRDGQPLGLVGIARDITDEVKRREQVRFNSDFRALLAEASARFVRVHDTGTFDAAVDHTLASLGHLFGMDRTYLLRFSDDLSTLTNTHEWCAPGIVAQIDRIQQFPTANIPWWMSQMLELRPVHIPDVTLLPDEAAAEREEYQLQNIQSLLCLPIYDEHKKLIGFMGMDFVRSLYEWPEEQIVLLQMLAEIIGNVIARLESLRLLVENKEMLQQSNAEKDKLFSIIAHDLRSPMSGLLTSTEFMASQPENLSEKDFQFLIKELYKNAKNSFELLEDLLQWARMNQGGIDYAPSPCSLIELFRTGLSTAQDMASSKKINLNLTISTGLTVLVDQPMVKTVIRNVLFNAIKFSHRGGEIVITARQEGRTVTVAIQDNGIGMKEQVLATLFTLDKEKRQLGTEGEKGTGLGMVLCKQFIEQHGGEIWAESELGKGTTVFFTLPANV